MLLPEGSGDRVPHGSNTAERSVAASISRREYDYSSTCIFFSRPRVAAALVKRLCQVPYLGLVYTLL